MKSSKGGEFERQFSKTFSKYITEGKRDDVFWRSSQSGGRATQRAKKGKQTAGSYGDITCLDPDFSFITESICFELKRGYNQANLQDLLDSNKKEPELIAFYNQCERDRVLGDRKWVFVVMKRDRKKPLFLISRTFHNLLSRKIGKRLYNKIDVDYDGLRFTVVPMDDFLSKVPASIFIKTIKENI